MGCAGFGETEVNQTRPALKDLTAPPHQLNLSGLLQEGCQQLCAGQNLFPLLGRQEGDFWALIPGLCRVFLRQGSSRWWGAYREAWGWTTPSCTSRACCSLLRSWLGELRGRASSPQGPDWRNKELEVFIPGGVSDRSSHAHSSFTISQAARRDQAVHKLSHVQRCWPCPPRGSEQPCAGGGRWGTEGHFCLSEVRDPDRLNFAPLHEPKVLSRPEQLPGDTCPLGQGNFIELFLSIILLALFRLYGTAIWMLGILDWSSGFFSFVSFLTVFHLFVIMY